MRTVRYDAETYLLVKRSSESSLVRDPASGAERYVPNDELEPVDEPPLETAACAVPEDVRAVLRVAHSDRALGLLVDLHETGPTPVRELLSRSDLCESDLLGLLTECRAAGVVEETTIAGERGYALSETGEEGIEALLSLR